MYPLQPLTPTLSPEYRGEGVKPRGSRLMDRPLMMNIAEKVVNRVIAHALIVGRRRP